MATYLAANPLAGVAAAAVIGGALFAASKAFGASDVDTEFGVTTGSDMSGGFSGIPSSGGGGGGGGGGFSGGGAGGSGGSSGGSSGLISGAVNLPDLVRKLQGVSDKIADTTFLLATDAISSKTAQKQLNALQKEFAVLERQGNALSAMEASSAFNPLSSFTQMTGRDAPTNITVNMGIVGDPEGAKRAIIDLQNEGFYRGTGGGNLLQGLK